jgi:hypothetical protein
VRDVQLRRDVDRRRYLDITVRRLKTHQEGIGRHVVINELLGTDKLCAVRALVRWLAVDDVAGDPAAPLFS